MSWLLTCMNDVLSSFVGVKLVRGRPSLRSLSLYQDTVRPSEPKYVNVGAGTFRHPYWHNLDYPNKFYSAAQRRNIHITHDLSRLTPIPIRTSSLRVIYCSHVVEHLTDRCVEYFLGEAFRCLERGGILRISCPDIDLEYQAFTRGDIEFWPFPSPWGTGALSIEQRFLEHFATVLTERHPDSSCRKFRDADVREVFKRLSMQDALKFLVDSIPPASLAKYPENHVNWFNEEKLTCMLRKAGFKLVRPSKYGQSHCPLLRDVLLFDSTCPEVSLYVECER